MRKPRHQKLFSDKFQITSEKILPSMISKIFNDISETKIEITHKTIRSILSSLDLYQGIFYIKPTDANFNRHRNSPYPWVGDVRCQT